MTWPRHWTCWLSWKLNRQASVSSTYRYDSNTAAVLWMIKTACLLCLDYWKVNTSAALSLHNVAPASITPVQDCAQMHSVTNVHPCLYCWYIYVLDKETSSCQSLLAVASAIPAEHQI